MAMPQSLLLFSLITLLSFLSLSVNCATFTFANNCGYTVWPGILSGAGTAALDATGFTLSGGQSCSLDVPSSWTGRLWGRTYCSTDPSTDTFSCATGDCGSGKLNCSGGSATPPATLAEFTLDGSGGMDFFDISLVDGYNIPMLITPSDTAGGGNCTTTGCVVDLNAQCPADLRVTLSSSGGQRVACRSACNAFATPEFCCSGAYSSPDTCKPSSYSQFFKNACPRAYSYAYDDATSTFTCPTGVNYVIDFCPRVFSHKAGERNPEAAAVPLIDDTMMFLVPVDSVAAALVRPLAVSAAMAGMAVLWLAVCRQLPE